MDTEAAHACYCGEAELMEVCMVVFRNAVVLYGQELVLQGRRIRETNPCSTTARQHIRWADCFYTFQRMDGMGQAMLISVV